MVIDFITRTSKLEASYQILSKVPADVKPDWDFGDNRGKSNELNPRYTYEASGFYTVTLTVDGTSISHTVVVTDHVNTHLTNSIYSLIDMYIPKDLSIEMTLEDKMAYINKWQLYIQPLVEHTIPIEEYSNELYYEGLENQLVMELAIYDCLYTKVTKVLFNTGNYLSNMGKSDKDRVKQITTGPSEVQFFDEVTEASSAILKVYYNAIQPGGIIDNLRINICMLADRLNIYLPICSKTNTVVAPSVSLRREPGLLGGPNPGSIVNSPTKSLIPE